MKKVFARVEGPRVKGWGGSGDKCECMVSDSWHLRLRAAER